MSLFTTISGNALLPYIPQITDRKENIITIYKPTRKIGGCLRSAKDRRVPLSASGIYHISCTFRSVYVGTTKRSANNRRNK